jgi:hypothetical protein
VVAGFSLFSFDVKTREQPFLEDFLKFEEMCTDRVLRNISPRSLTPLENGTGTFPGRKQRQHFP